MTDEEAREAVAAYAEAQESIKEPEKAKRAALDTLKAWMRRQGDSKATVNGEDGQPRADDTVLDEPPEAQRAPRPGDPGRGGDREASRSTSGSASRSLIGSAGRGRLTHLQGRTAPPTSRRARKHAPHPLRRRIEMARTINKVELLGRVGTDPEMRYTPGGTAVTKLRLATDRYRRDADDETDWHNIVVWNGTAEAVNQYVSEGQRIYVAGSPGPEHVGGRRRPAPPPHRGPRLRGRVPRRRERQRRTGARRLALRVGRQPTNIATPTLQPGATPTGPLSNPREAAPPSLSNSTQQGGRHDNEHDHVAGQGGARHILQRHSPHNPGPARPPGTMPCGPWTPPTCGAACCSWNGCPRPARRGSWSWRNAVPGGPPW